MRFLKRGGFADALATRRARLAREPQLGACGSAPMLKGRLLGEGKPCAKLPLIGAEALKLLRVVAAAWSAAIGADW